MKQFLINQNRSTNLLNQFKNQYFLNFKFWVLKMISNLLLLSLLKTRKKTMNESGSIVYVLIISIGIAASVLAMHFQTLGQLAANDIAQQRLLQVLEVKKAAITEMLTNGISWVNTLQSTAPDSSYGAANNNYLLSCMNDPSYICSTTPFNIVVANSENAVLDFISSGSGTRGFDRTGTSCNNFGSSSCPFRYTVQVTPDCSNISATATACNQPYRLLITVNLNFTNSAQDIFNLKASKYSFTIEK